MLICVASSRSLVREMMAEALRVRYGSDVVQFTSPKEMTSAEHGVIDAGVIVVDASPLDIWLPAIGALRTRCRFVIATAATGDYVLARGGEVGAQGFVHESDHLAELFAAVDTVARGGCYTSPAVAAQRASPAVMPLLSNRELEVLRLSCRGLSDEEAGKILGLSPSTIESHRTTILQKLTISDWAELLIVGLRAGVVALGEIEVRSRRRRSAARGRQRPQRQRKGSRRA